MNDGWIPRVSAIRPTKTLPTRPFPAGPRCKPRSAGRTYPTKMTLEGMDYKFEQPSRGAHGNVVVNADEIVFFNGNVCGLSLPRGVGEYRWELVDESTLKLTALNEDPCGRVEILSGETWTRALTSPTQSP